MEQEEKHKQRCSWCGDDPAYVAYHDNEWGKLCGGDRRLFEFLVLEGAQAGLSWLTILHKRKGYMDAFCGFDPSRVAQFGEEDVERLMHHEGIVRNRLKIKSAINNARLFMEVQQEFGSFDAYIRRFLPAGEPVDNKPLSTNDIAVKSAVSDNMSADMRRRGFKFFGSVICYSFLQATGYVNDHLACCPFR